MMDDNHIRFVIQNLLHVISKLHISTLLLPLCTETLKWVNASPVFSPSSTASRKLRNRLPLLKGDSFQTLALRTLYPFKETHHRKGRCCEASSSTATSGQPKEDEYPHL